MDSRGGVPREACLGQQSCPRGPRPTQRVRSCALPEYRVLSACCLKGRSDKLDVSPQVGSILVTGLGAAALMKGPFPRANFFIAGVAVYMGTIVLEAVSMSLCSKVRPQG